MQHEINVVSRNLTIAHCTGSLLLTANCWSPKKHLTACLGLGNGAQTRREGCNGNCKNLSCSRHSHGRDDRQQQVDNNNSNSSCSLQEVAPGGAGGGGAPPAGDNQDSIAGRTKGVSLAPQTHSGPTGPPSSPETSSATPPAPKLQPALETVRESVMEEGPSKEPGDQGAPPTTEPSAKAAAEGSGASGGSSGSCSNPATVHRQRRLRTPTWARSMSTNKTYLKLHF